MSSNMMSLFYPRWVKMPGTFGILCASGLHIDIFHESRIKYGKDLRLFSTVVPNVGYTLHRGAI